MNACVPWCADLDSLVDTRDRLLIYIEGLRDALGTIAYCGGEEPVSVDQLQAMARDALEPENSQSRPAE